MKFLFGYKRTIKPFTYIISCLFTVVLPISFLLSPFFIPCLCSSTPRLPPSLSLAALLVLVITISFTSSLLFTLSQHHHLPSVFSFSIAIYLFSSSTSACCDFCKLIIAAPFLFHHCRCCCRWCAIPAAALFSTASSPSSSLSGSRCRCCLGGLLLL